MKLNFNLVSLSICNIMYVSYSDENISSGVTGVCVVIKTFEGCNFIF